MTFDILSKNTQSFSLAQLEIRKRLQLVPDILQDDIAKCINAYENKKPHEEIKITRADQFIHIALTTNIRHSFINAKEVQHVKDLYDALRRYYLRK